MSLTGYPFLVTTVLLAVGAVALLLARWDRIRGLFPRLTMLLLCQVTALVTVFAVTNHAQGFYATWDDLLGGSSESGKLSGDDGGPPPGGTVGASRPFQRVLRNNQRFEPYTEGFVQTALAGKRSGISGEVAVWVPPGYHDPANRGRSYPVLMLLHGVPGSVSGWVGPMDIGATVEPLVKSGKLQPFIMVVPYIGGGSRNTECSDVPGRALISTWLTQDVRQMVLDNFRATEAGTGWGVMGYSTGGFCAVSLALRHPELMHAGVGLASDNFGGSRVAYATAEQRQQNSPLWLLKHGSGQQRPRILLAASRQDSSAKLSYSQELQRLAPETVTLLAFEKGGHSQGTWKKMMPQSLEWLNRQLRG